jgi:hypothetical protein
LAPATARAPIKAMIARRKNVNGTLHFSELKRFVAGADVFSKQSDGTTVAAQYARQGITLRCANTDRVNGWAEILQRFGEPSVGIAEGGSKPTLFIHKRCARLIRVFAFVAT